MSNAVTCSPDVLPEARKPGMEAWAVKQSAPTIETFCGEVASLQRQVCPSERLGHVVDQQSLVQRVQRLERILGVPQEDSSSDSGVAGETVMEQLQHIRGHVQSLTSAAGCAGPVLEGTEKSGPPQETNLEMEIARLFAASEILDERLDTFAKLVHSSMDDYDKALKTTCNRVDELHNKLESWEACQAKASASIRDRLAVKVDVKQSCCVRPLAAQGGSLIATTCTQSSNGPEQSVLCAEGSRKAINDFRPATSPPRATHLSARAVGAASRAAASLPRSRPSATPPWSASCTMRAASVTPPGCAGTSSFRSPAKTIALPTAAAFTQQPMHPPCLVMTPRPTSAVVESRISRSSPPLRVSSRVETTAPRANIRVSL